MGKPGSKNVGPNHLSWLTSREDTRNLDDNMPYVNIFAVNMVDGYLTEIVHLLSIVTTPWEYTIVQKEQLVVKAVDYQLIAGNLYNLGAYGILRRCSVLEKERTMMLVEAREGITGVHYAGKETSQKILWTRP